MEDKLKCEVSGSFYEPGTFSDRVHQYIASASQQELGENLKKVVSNINEFLAWFDGLIWELSIHSEEIIANNRASIEGIPQSDIYKLLYDRWNLIGIFILEKMPQQAALSRRLYQKFLQVIKKVEKINKGGWIRKHKGAIYHHIGLSLLYLNEQEKAKNYFLLGTIEDMLTQGIDTDDFKMNPGYQAVQSLKIFTDEDKTIKTIKDLLKKKQDKRKQIEIANPELILLEFMTNSKNKINASQFLLWDNVFAELLIKEVDNTSDTQELGHYLEMVAAYFFFTIGKFEVNCNVKTLHAEHDLRVRNLIIGDPIMELLGRYLLAECKNWNANIDSTKVKKFIANVRFSRCDTGILFTRKLITGQKNRDSGWYVARAEYHKDGIIIILLTLEDLLEVANDKITFMDLLKKKYEQIRFDER